MELKLGKRLSAIADLVEGKTLIDIGTDHGKLPVKLLLNGTIQYAIATDLNPLPLQKAIETAKQFGTYDKMEFIQASGLELEDSVIDKSDTIVIAGMGGELIAEILEKSKKEIIVGKKIIVQPMSRVEFFHEWIYKNGFGILEEYAIEENGKYYLVLALEYTAQHLTITEREKFIGKLNAKQSSGYILRRLRKTREKLMEMEKAEREKGIVNEKSSLKEAILSFAEIEQMLTEIKENVDR